MRVDTSVMTAEEAADAVIDAVGDRAGLDPTMPSPLARVALLTAEWRVH